MAKFYKDSNNGVIALIREDHAKALTRIILAGGDPSLDPEIKIFTFRPYEDSDTPEQRLYCSGSWEDLRTLIDGGGHRVAEGFALNVPFSNKFQYPKNSQAELDRRDAELRWHTTVADMARVFGLESMKALGEHYAQE